MEPPYRICLVGNFVPKKRQYTTIQMFYDVVQEFGDEFKLDIVGARGMWTGYGNPEYFINCQDLIEDLGLKDKVSIFDKIAFQEMPDLYKREHIILSTSNEEGTHVSVAEAVASGCFAFVGNWRGSSDVYPEPETCWHFKSPGELMGLFRRFKECVSSGEAAERSRTCSEHVHKTLGGTDRYDRMVKVMEQALKARREGVEA